MESGGTNLSDIYRKEALLGGSAFSRLYNRHCNSVKFSFHLPEAVVKVLSVRTYYKYLDLSSCLLSSIFLLESGVTNARVSLVNRMNIL